MKDGNAAEEHKVEGSTLQRRSPLLLVGEAPAFLRRALGEPLAWSELKSTNAYFLLFVRSEGESVAPPAEELLQRQVPADQILLAFDAAAGTPAGLHAFAGRVSLSADESTEELRHHLASALVAQRHRKLAVELERAGQLGPDSADRERAHLAHAFALAWELSPQQHGLAIRLSLGPLTETFRPDTAPEAALALTAALAQRHWRDPARFREEFRREAAPLPLRLRTDLRNLAERCLEGFWRKHA